MEKILLDFSEIQAQLLEFFLATPIDLREGSTDLLLKESNLDIESVEKVEAILKVKFPDSFKQTILQYDFGDLALGGVWFGRKANYAEYLIKENTCHTKDKKIGSYFATWWGGGERPSNYLSIADSDGYIILLNIETGKIMACDRTESYQEAKLIASDLRIFLQAIATVYIRLMTDKNKDLLIDIPRVVGSVADNEFWEEIMLD
jgi:SMI1-KNR4 cell-wall